MARKYLVFFYLLILLPLSVYGQGTCTGSGCVSTCGTGASGVATVGGAGGELEDGSADTGVPQASTGPFTGGRGAPPADEDADTKVDKQGRVKGPITGGEWHGGNAGTPPQGDPTPEDPPSKATVSPHGPITGGVFSVTVKEAGGQTTYPGGGPTAVKCKAGGCAPPGSGCGAGGKGVCEAKAPVSPAGEYTCSCKMPPDKKKVVTGTPQPTVQPTVTGTPLRLPMSSGTGGSSGTSVVEDDDFSSLLVPIGDDDTARASPDFTASTDNSSPPSALSSSSTTSVDSSSTSTVALTRRTPAAYYNYANLKETGIIWIWYKDGSKLIAQKPNREFLEYVEIIPGSLQYVLQAEYGAWGELKKLHMYDTNWKRTGVRYGSGVERKYSWETSSTFRIDTYVYPNDQYQSGTETLFSTERRTYGNKLHTGSNTYIRRLTSIEFPETDYVEQETGGSPFFDINNLKTAKLIHEISHHPTNTYATQAKVVRKTASGNRLQEDTYLQVNWVLDNNTWRVSQTVDAQNITRTYARNLVPNSQGITWMRVTAPTHTLTYEYDRYHRPVKRTRRSLLNPRGTEDTERSMIFAYEAGSTQPRLLTQMTGYNGMTWRADYHPTLGVIEKEYINDPSSSTGEVERDYFYSSHPLDGPRLEKVIREDSSEVKFTYTDQQTSLPFDAGFSVATEVRTYPSIQLVSGDTQSLSWSRVFDNQGRVTRKGHSSGYEIRYDYDDLNHRGLVDSIETGGDDSLNRSFAWFERDLIGFPTDFYEGGAKSDRSNSSAFVHTSYVRSPYGKLDELTKHNDGGRPSRHFKYHRDWLNRRAVTLAQNLSSTGQAPTSWDGSQSGMPYTRSEHHRNLIGATTRAVKYAGPLYISEATARADLLSNYRITDYSYAANSGALESLSDGRESLNFTFDGYHDLHEMRIGTGPVLSKHSLNMPGTKKIERLARETSPGLFSYTSTEHSYDRGYLKEIKHTAGGEEEKYLYGRDQLGQVTSYEYQINGVGQQLYEYEYDELGREIRNYMSALTGGATERVQRYETEYNVWSQPEWIENHRGEQESYTYDDIGRLTSSIYGDMAYGYTYIPHRNWTKTTEKFAAGVPYKLETKYDRLGNMVEGIDYGSPANQSAPLSDKLKYNSYGMADRAEQADGTNFILSRGLDSFQWWENTIEGTNVFLRRDRVRTASGDRVTTYDPADRATVRTYNTRGQLLDETYPGAIPVRFTYDGANNLKSVIRGNTLKVFEQRFPNGMRKQVRHSFIADPTVTYSPGMPTLPQGQILQTFYRNNARHWKVEEQGPNYTSRLESRYNKFGVLDKETVFVNVAGHAPHTSEVTLRQRDSGGAYDFRNHHIDIAGSTINDVSWDIGYDSASRAQSYGYTSSQFNNLPSTVATFSYFGPRLQEIKANADQLEVSYTFDGFGRLDGSTTSWNAQLRDGYFLYRNPDANIDRAIELFAPFGGAGNAWDYDDFSRPIAEKQGVPLAELLNQPDFSQLSYQMRSDTSFDRGGESQILDLRSTTTMSGSTISSFDYTTEAARGIVDSITRNGGITHQLVYDNAGNITRDEAAANGAGREYSYDPLQRMIEAHDSNGDLIAKYGYGARNRMLWRENADGTISYNFYLNWLLLGDEDEDGNSRLLTYAPGENPDQLLSLHVNRGGQEKFYHFSATDDGSPSAAFDDQDLQGQPVERYKYLTVGGLPLVFPNGTSPSQLSSQIGSPLGHQGGYWDSEVQIYHKGMRTSDPYSALFHSRDPRIHLYDLEFEYALLENRPKIIRDPDGGQGKGVIKAIWDWVWRKGDDVADDAGRAGRRGRKAGRLIDGDEGRGIRPDFDDSIRIHDPNPTTMDGITITSGPKTPSGSGGPQGSKSGSTGAPEPAPVGPSTPETPTTPSSKPDTDGSGGPSTGSNSDAGNTGNTTARPDSDSGPTTGGSKSSCKDGDCPPEKTISGRGKTIETFEIDGAKINISDDGTFDVHIDVNGDEVGMVAQSNVSDDGFLEISEISQFITGSEQGKDGIWRTKDGRKVAGLLGSRFMFKLIKGTSAYAKKKGFCGIRIKDTNRMKTSSSKKGGHDFPEIERRFND